MRFLPHAVYIAPYFVGTTVLLPAHTYVRLDPTTHDDPRQSRALMSCMTYIDVDDIMQHEMLVRRIGILGITVEVCCINNIFFL